MSLHEKLAKKRAGNRNQIGWRPKDGENRIRILPARARFIDDWNSMDDLAIAYKIHFFKIEGRPTEVSRCLEELKQRCPACEVWRANKHTEDPGLKELTKQIRPADQYLFNILDINNLQQGIQPWASNYTCWDKVMEIAANPQWGNVVDPSNGVNFTITLTPGSRAKSGHNTYSVMPDPQRTTVEAILQAIPDWRAKLDELENQISDAKTAEEMIPLLIEMGFPQVPGSKAAAPAAVGGPVPVPHAAAPTPVPHMAPAPVPAAAPVPVAAPALVPVAAPAPVPVVAHAAVHPVVAPGAPTPTPTPVATLTPAPAASTGGPHYDPGEGYKEKFPASERPAGAPRCFGDYEPRQHRCQPCPHLTDCQLKMIGVPV